jgi:exonuclease SbcD
VPLRVLHTSDWHLGISYEGVSRREDHDLFLSWLNRTLREEAVDVLLIAGDVFDQHNPPAEALELWYRFLASLSDSPVRDVVVIAGNHDSAARLEAPSSVLGRVGVHVRGRFVDDVESKTRLLVPVCLDPSGRPAAVVVAVPYVHEYRLGIRTTALQGEELGAAFDTRFSQLYAELTDLARELYGDTPLVGMGHLTCAGSDPDDSPHAIHMVGGIGGLPESVFGNEFAYVALGHIHRMMPTPQAGAWYSGTPIPMSRRESMTRRHILLVDVDGTERVRPKAHAVPRFRDIVQLEGNSQEVLDGIAQLSWSEPLPPLVNVELQLDQPDLSESARVRSFFAEQFLDADSRPHLVRVHQTVDGATSGGLPDGGGEVTTSVRDMGPEEVFVRLCAHAGIDPDPELITAFRSVLSEEEEE